MTTPEGRICNSQTTSEPDWRLSLSLALDCDFKKRPSVAHRTMATLLHVIMRQRRVIVVTGRTGAGRVFGDEMLHQFGRNRFSVAQTAPHRRSAAEIHII